MSHPDKPRPQPSTESAARRQAQTPSADSADNFGAFFNTIEDLLFVIAPDGNILWANRAALARLEYQEPELVGQSVLEIHPAERRAEAQQIIAQMLAGQAEVCPVPLVTKSGRLIAAETRVTRGRWNGQDALFGVSRDISALRASEERFSKAFHSNPSPMAITSLGEGRFLEVNEAFLQTLGYRREDIVGADVTEVNVFADPAQRAAALEIIVRTGNLRNFAATVRTKDGRPRQGLFAAEIIQLQDQQVLLTVMNDITELRAAEETLQQSHDELRAIYDGTPDGLLIADIETKRLLHCNAAAARMLGCTEEEILTLSVPDIHPPESMPAILEYLHKNAGREMWIAPDLPVLRRDGTCFYADVATSRLNYRGRPCLIGFFRDMTERHATEEALERERQSLWRMLQASDHERQIISYEIHDGLAQYLAAAIMQFQTHDVLRHSAQADARKAYETALELVRQAHTEARRLINEVRPPVIDETGIETAISHLVFEQRRHGGPLIESHSSVQFGRLPPIVENALYRITQEALTNACQHSQSAKVTVTLVQQGPEIRLEVRDWGVGFNPDASQRGHFGLEGIRQRVRLLGGRLNITSAPGEGTTLQVMVPIPAGC